eukprot:Gb_04518 [translate_table: standard]
MLLEGLVSSPHKLSLLHSPLSEMLTVSLVLQPNSLALSIPEQTEFVVPASSLSPRQFTEWCLRVSCNASLTVSALLSSSIKNISPSIFFFPANLPFLSANSSAFLRRKYLYNH